MWTFVAVMSELRIAGEFSLTDISSVLDIHSLIITLTPFEKLC